VAGVIILPGSCVGELCTVSKQLYTEGEELNYVKTGDLANGSFRTEHSENMKRSISTARIQQLHDFMVKTDGGLVETELATTFVRSASWHNLAPEASGVPRGGFGVFKPPPPRNSKDIGGVLDRMSKKERRLDFLL